MFKKGDKYIHFTKYGSIHRGIIDRIVETTAVDIKNCVRYTTYRMINTNNVMYNLDGTDGRFYTVDEEFTQEQCDLLKVGFNKKHYEATLMINRHGLPGESKDRVKKEENFESLGKNLTIKKQWDLIIKNFKKLK